MNYQLSSKSLRSKIKLQKYLFVVSNSNTFGPSNFLMSFSSQDCIYTCSLNVMLMSAVKNWIFLPRNLQISLLISNQGPVFIEHFQILFLIVT
ncbi:hypothetical protein Hanom_Chr11g00973391 [Helianthus anomalus]